MVMLSRFVALHFAKRKASLLQGQMTSAGVPALDFAPEGYPTKFGETSDTVEKNLPPALWRLLSKLRKPNYVVSPAAPFASLEA